MQIKEANVASRSPLVATVGMTTTKSATGPVQGPWSWVTTASAGADVSAGPQPRSFAETLDGTADKRQGAIAPAASKATGVQAAGKLQKSFEAVALQAFISSMLPQERSGMFGTGSAGAMWRSLLAEKIAEKIASGQSLRLLPAAAFGGKVGAAPSTSVNAGTQQLRPDALKPWRIEVTAGTGEMPAFVSKWEKVGE